jgi:Mrp family chromosome partitioning ATPase
VARTVSPAGTVGVTNGSSAVVQAGRAPLDVVSSLDDTPEEAVDAVRYLIASLHRDDQALLPRLGFTSALAGEGVTFVSRTVATVMAHDARQRVCLIDLNWGTQGEAHRGRKGKRRRRASEAPTSDVPVGLADVLRRDASLRDVMLETEDPNLTLVPAGRATPAEGQVFARSERLAQVLTILQRHTDNLILDLPPVLVSSAAIPLARLAGSVALVVRQGVTTDAQVRAALDHLSPIPSAGVVLNRASSRIPRPVLRRLASW